MGDHFVLLVFFTQEATRLPVVICSEILDSQMRRCVQCLPAFWTSQLQHGRVMQRDWHAASRGVTPWRPTGRELEATKSVIRFKLYNSLCLSVTSSPQGIKSQRRSPFIVIVATSLTVLNHTSIHYCVLVLHGIIRKQDLLNQECCSPPNRRGYINLLSQFLMFSLSSGDLLNAKATGLGLSTCTTGFLSLKAQCPRPLTWSTWASCLTLSGIWSWRCCSGTRSWGRLRSSVYGEKRTFPVNWTKLHFLSLR